MFYDTGRKAVKWLTTSYEGRAIMNITGADYLARNVVAPMVKPYHDYLNTPRGRYEITAALYKTSILGDILRHHDHMEEMDNTLPLYGLDYDDIHYTGKTLGADGGYNFTWDFVSDNIRDLYK